MERGEVRKGLSPAKTSPKLAKQPERKTTPISFRTPTKTRPKSPFETVGKYANSEAKQGSGQVTSGIDLLLEDYKRRKQLGTSPKPAPKEFTNCVQSVTQRELATTEKALIEACAGITVKTLNLLKGHTLPSTDLERVFYAFLALFAEVDSSIEVGPNGRVLTSRVWPVVVNYLQSPGQAVQTARKFQSWVQSGKLSKSAVNRAAEALSEVNEEGLRASTKGEVGIVVYIYLKCGLEYYQAHERITGTKSEVTPRKSIRRSQTSPERHESVPMVSVSSLTPVETESDQAPESDPRNPAPAAEIAVSDHVKGAPSFGSGAFDLQPARDSIRTPHSPLGERRKTHLESKISRSKSHDDVRRSHSVLEVTVDWELDSAYRAFLKQKLDKSTGRSEVVLRKDSILDQFRIYLKSIPGLQPHFSSPVVQSQISAFIDRMRREDGVYQEQLHSAAKQSRRK